MNVNNVNQRFLNDPEFHRAVKLIEDIMYQSTLTPLDVRDACYLARIKFEQLHVRPIIMSKEYLKRKGER